MTTWRTEQDWQLVPDLGEHALARFLRKYGGIDNYQNIGPNTVWYGPDGRAVVTCIYSGGIGCSYYLRRDLAAIEKGNT